MDKNTALMAAGIIFLIVGIFHLLRLVIKFEVKIAGKDIPLYANVFGLIFAGLLAWWMFAAASSKQIGF